MKLPHNLYFSLLYIPNWKRAKSEIFNEIDENVSFVAIYGSKHNPQQTKGRSPSMTTTNKAQHGNMLGNWTQISDTYARKISNAEPKVITLLVIPVPHRPHRCTPRGTVYMGPITCSSLFGLKPSNALFLLPFVGMNLPDFLRKIALFRLRLSKNCDAGWQFRISNFRL